MCGFRLFAGVPGCLRGLPGSGGGDLAGINELRLEVRDFAGQGQWQWLLTEEGTGRAVADHQVELAGTPGEFGALQRRGQFLCAMSVRTAVLMPPSRASIDLLAAAKSPKYQRR